MATFDFDFKRYVERRKGARDAERREGAGYAYAGDLRLRKLLARVRPVTLALDATVRLWRATARASLVGTARKATEAAEPRVVRLLGLAAGRLHVSAPPLYLSPLPRVSIGTYGTDDDAQILLHAGLAAELSDEALLHALGAECGRVQNSHVLLGTARYSLHGTSIGFVRWIVGPAVASLDAWERRAVITADRAGLLASRDLAASLSAMATLERARAVALGSAAPSTTEATGTASEPAELAAAEPGALDLRARQAALEVFAKSAYYRGALGESGGLSPSETDKATAKALAAAAKASAAAAKGGK